MNVRGFFEALQIAAGIRHRARLFIGKGGGQEDVGVLRCFGEEHVLHNQERTRERVAVAIAGGRV